MYMYFEVKTCNQFEDLVHLEVTFSGVTLFMVTAVYFVPVSSNVTFVMTESQLILFQKTLLMLKLWNSQLM